MQVRYQEDKLLTQVINLRRRYLLVDKLSARPFNLFSVLKTERNERFTHSAFIVELLNPKGSHCQGEIFLKLFLQILTEIPKEVLDNLSKAKVEVERYTGNGFIDIWIDLGNFSLCIENKIDAKDQKNQLLRYNDHCIEHKRPFKLIYLTLDGHESEDVKSGSKVDYIRWSYLEQIIPWLNQCIKEAARLPIIRETIFQYLEIVKKLCGVLQNENEAMELNELLKKDFEHFEAANNIHDQFKRAQFDIKYDFWNDVKKYYTDKYGEDFLVEFNFSESDSYPKIIIGHRHLENWDACFCIEWLQRNPYYGIFCYSFGELTSEQKKIVKDFNDLSLPGYKSSDWWYSYRYYNNVNFSTIATLESIFELSSRTELILRVTKPVDDLIEQYGNRVLELNNQIRKRFSELS